LTCSRRTDGSSRSRCSCRIRCAQCRRTAAHELTHEQFVARIEEFLISIGPDTGQLLHTLARSLRAKNIVEIGASYGYSTIWLADAARAVSGKVHSFELSQKKVDFIKDKLRSVGLQDYVEFHVGDALQNLPKLNVPLDLVLIDCWKSLYIPCFKLLHPRLASGGVIVADNMLYPVETQSDANKYRAFVHETKDLDSVLLPIGSGIELSRKRS
jgi:predicted O-methyltransferase YrrM